MRSYDLSPLYRSTVGFDRVFDLLDTMSKAETGGYPPYNIERLDENDYRITVAVAGFSEADLDLEVHENTLKITGARSENEQGREFLYQGIAGRSFERRFELAEHVRIAGASLVNGLLNIELHREVPESAKPRKIAISNGATAKIKVVNDANAA